MLISLMLQLTSGAVLGLSSMTNPPSLQWGWSWTHLEAWIAEPLNFSRIRYRFSGTDSTTGNPYNREWSYGTFGGDFLLGCGLRIPMDSTLTTVFGLWSSLPGTAFWVEKDPEAFWWSHGLWIGPELRRHHWLMGIGITWQGDLMIRHYTNARHERSEGMEYEGKWNIGMRLGYAF